MTTPIHETDKAASVAAYFVTKPQSRTKWWHWIIGFALICLLSFLGMTGLFLASQNLFPTNDATIYLDLLIAFLPVFITIPLIYKFWHKRPIIIQIIKKGGFDAIEARNRIKTQFSTQSLQRKTLSVYNDLLK